MPNSRWGGACLAVVTVLASGCSDVRDGDSRVQDLGRFSAEVQEELRIDGLAEDLVPIRDIAVADDGTIAVLQPQDGVVRFFDSQGILVAEVGHQGQGPGEFMAMASVGWLADTLWVFDPRQRRFALIAPAWSFMRHVSNVPRSAEASSAEVPGGLAFPFVIPEGLLGDGSFVALMMVAAGENVPAVFVDRAAIGRVSFDGAVERMVSLLPRPEGANVVTPEGESASLPFGNSPVHDVAPLQDRLAVAMASLEGTDGGTFSVTLMTLDGDTAVAGRYSFDGERIPVTVADSIVEARVALAARVSPRLGEAVRDAIRVPPVYPPLEDLVVGRDGTVWIGLHERGAGARYAVIESTGEPVGRLVLPSGSRVGVAERSSVWVIERDSLDVESVVRYGVSWTPN